MTIYLLYLYVFLMRQEQIADCKSKFLSWDDKICSFIHLWPQRLNAVRQGPQKHNNKYKFDTFTHVRLEIKECIL